ncbi:hypothetical protein GF407_05705 [candidate division KSB1 bacterium]|nr:hypothetical protein [candidate division KSB1 bacterium]
MDWKRLLYQEMDEAYKTTAHLFELVDAGQLQMIGRLNQRKAKLFYYLKLQGLSRKHRASLRYR